MSEDNNVRLIPQGKPTDMETAMALREEAQIHIDALCKVMDAARAAGLTLNFNIVADQHGRNRCPDIMIVKPL